MPDLVNESSQGLVPFTTSPAQPTALSAGVDTTFTFSQPVNHIFIQNKSASPVYVGFDAVATVGSAEVYPAGGNLFFDVPALTVHLFSVAGTNVNGSSDLNIVLLGWG